MCVCVFLQTMLTFLYMYYSKKCKDAERLTTTTIIVTTLTISNRKCTSHIHDYKSTQHALCSKMCS